MYTYTIYYRYTNKHDTLMIKYINDIFLLKGMRYINVFFTRKR